MWQSTSKPGIGVRLATLSVIAGLVVGAPWPMTGTVVGAWILLLAGLQRGKTTVNDKETK